MIKSVSIPQIYPVAGRSLLQETAYNEAEEAPIQKYSVLLKSRVRDSWLSGVDWFWGGCFCSPALQSRKMTHVKISKKIHRIFLMYIFQSWGWALSKPTSASTQCIGLFSLFTCTCVSKNNGTPKSSILIDLIGFSIINHPFWGTHIFGNTHIHHKKSTIHVSKQTIHWVFGIMYCPGPYHLWYIYQ